MNLSETPDHAPLWASADAAERSLAGALRTAIDSSGWTQAEVSRQLGLVHNYVTQLLRGNLDLKLCQVLEILGVIDVSPVEFFGALYGTSPSKAEVLIERLTAEISAALGGEGESDAGDE